MNLGCFSSLCGDCGFLFRHVTNDSCQLQTERVVAVGHGALENSRQLLQLWSQWRFRSCGLGVGCCGGWRGGKNWLVVVSSTGRFGWPRYILYGMYKCIWHVVRLRRQPSKWQIGYLFRYLPVIHLSSPNILIDRITTIYWIGWKECMWCVGLLFFEIFFFLIAALTQCRVTIGMGQCAICIVAAALYLSFSCLCGWDMRRIWHVPCWHESINLWWHVLALMFLLIWSEINEAAFVSTPRSSDIPKQASWAGDPFFGDQVLMLQMYGEFEGLFLF